MNNAIALLEECLYNGDKGILTLYAWFKGERHLIEDTIRELNGDKKEEAKDYYVDCSRRKKYVARSN